MNKRYNVEVASDDIAKLNAVPAVMETSRLLTAEEMDARDESCVLNYFEMNKPWSDPVYVCPNCGGGMCRENNVVYASYPPKHRYKCNKCEHTEYRYS